MSSLKNIRICLRIDSTLRFCEIVSHIAISKVQFLPYNGWGGANMEDFKKLRTEKQLTQQQAATFVGVSLRSYKSYENDAAKKWTIKYNYMLNKLSEINPIDEEHGLLSIADIKQKCADVFSRYAIHFCYLFGSYAKEVATPTSDVDLLTSWMFTAAISGIPWLPDNHSSSSAP